jgi:membrane protease YdiL (CAAX protease family)
MNSTRPSQDTALTNRFSEPVFVVLAYLLAQFSVLSMGEHFPGEHPFLVASIVSAFCASIAAVLAGAWVDRSNGGHFIGRMRPFGVQFAMCIFGGAGYSIFVYFIVSAFPYVGPENPMLAQAFLDKGPGIFLGWMANLLFVGPIGEEMVFRGAIQGYLSGRIGTGFAIVMSALLFLLLHVPQLDGYWPAMVAILGLGLVAGIARVRTGSLLGAIAVHIAYNSVVMAFVLVDHF